FTMTLLRMLSFNDSASSEAKPVAAPKPAGVATSAKPVASAAPTTPAATAAAAFDGDWPAFIERLRLTGMSGMAARNAELVSYQNNHLELVVPESHRMYAEKPYVDK